MRMRVIFAAGSAASTRLGRTSVAGATASDVRNVLRFIVILEVDSVAGPRRALVYSEISGAVGLPRIAASRKRKLLAVFRGCHIAPSVSSGTLSPENPSSR